MSYRNISPIINALIWPQLLHFNVGEAWGDPTKMDVRLLWGLDRVRHDLERKITVNCGYELSGHADKSFHKRGMAVDFVIHPPEPDIVDDLYDLYITVLSMWHGGVGVYPFWNTPGLHLDLGPDRSWVRSKEGIYYSDSNKIRDVVMSADV